LIDLLRLDRLLVVDTREEDSELIVTVRSKAPATVRCCLFPNVRKLGTKAIRCRDFTIQGQPVWLEVKRQRFSCSACGNVSYEHLPDLDPDFRMTIRFRDHLAEQAVQLPFTVAATQNGVHETLIRRIFARHADAVLRPYEPVLPRVLGMDEIYLHRRPRFVIGDVENGYMIDMQPSRQEKDLKPYFLKMEGRDKVEVVCQDMWTGYRTTTKAVFPRAVTVIDKYHVQRTANYGVEVVRKALYLDLDNKERIALKRRKAAFLARHGGKGATREVLDKAFASYPIMQRAYDLKERFYDIYEADSRARAEHLTNQWLASVPQEFERPFKPSITAFQNWRPHILRYFEHRYTSAYVERLNGLIRAMDRSGTGYSYDVLRDKALLKHGVFRKASASPRRPSAPPGAFTMEFKTAFSDAYVAAPRRLGAPISTLTADLDAGTF
jgi:transposase